MEKGWKWTDPMLRAHWYWHYKWKQTGKMWCDKMQRKQLPLPQTWLQQGQKRKTLQPGRGGNTEMTHIVYSVSVLIRAPYFYEYCKRKEQNVLLKIWRMLWKFVFIIKSSSVRSCFKSERRNKSTLSRMRKKLSAFYNL